VILIKGLLFGIIELTPCQKDVLASVEQVERNVTVHGIANDLVMHVGSI